MKQTWRDLLFAHWPFPPDEVRTLLPRGLELDTIDGSAWVGVVPFRMTGVRLRGLPPLPGASAFPELNVRTYLRHRGRAAVWFFSLDAASRLAVLGARAWLGLPYYRARMECRPLADGVAYRSERTDARGAPAALAADYRPTGDPAPAAPGTLAHWLTERRCLVSLRRGRAVVAEVRHPPWPLQPAEAEITENSMGRAAGLELRGSPLLHFARRLEVVVTVPGQTSTDSVR